MLALLLTPSLLVASFMLFRTEIPTGLSLFLSTAESRRLFCDMALSSLSPTTFFFRARLLLLLPLMFSGLLVLSVPIVPSSEPFSSKVFPLPSLIASSFGPFLLVTPAYPCFVAPLWYSLSRLVVPWSCRKCCGNVVSLLLATVTLLLSASCFLYWHFCPSFVAPPLLFPPFLIACPFFSSSFLTVTMFFALLLAIFKPFSSKVFSLFSLITCSFGPFLLVTPACPCFLVPLWHSLSRLVVPWSCRKCCGNVVSLLSATVTLLLSTSCFLYWHFCPSFLASSLLFLPFLTACPSFSSCFFIVTFFVALLLAIFKPFSSKVFSLFSLMTFSFGPFLLVTPACPCVVAPLWCSLSRLVEPWSCRKCCDNAVSLLSATVTLLFSTSCFLYWHFCPSFVASCLLFPPFLTACPSFSSSFFTVTFFVALLLAIFKPFSSKVFSLFSLITCSFGPFLLVTPTYPCFVAPLWHLLSRLAVPWSCRKYCGNVVSLLSAAVTLLLSASCFLCWHFCPSFVASSLLFPPFLTGCTSFSSSFFMVTMFFALLVAIFKPFSSEVFSLFSLITCSFGPFLLVTPTYPCFVAPLWHLLSRLVVSWSCRKYCGNVVSLLSATITLPFSAPFFLCWHFCPSFVACPLLFPSFLTASPSFSSSFSTVTFFFALLLELFFRGVCPWYLVPFSFVFSLNDTLSSRDNGREYSFSIETALLFLFSSLVSYCSVPLVSLLTTSEESPEPSGRFLPWENRLVWSLAFSLFFVSDACSCVLSHLSDRPDLKSDGGSWPCVTSLKGDCSTCFCFSLGLRTLRPGGHSITPKTHSSFYRTVIWESTSKWS